MGAPNLGGAVWHWRQLSARTWSTSHGSPLLPPELVLPVLVVVEPPVPPEPPVLAEPPLQAKRKSDDESEINCAARVVTKAMKRWYAGPRAGVDGEQVSVNRA
jgi:hypothetical protein